MASRPIIDRISPLWLGIGISSSLLLLMFLIETVTGRWSGLLIGGEFDPLAKVQGGMLRDIRIAIVHCLLMGYLPAVLLYAMRSGRRTVLVLQKSLATIDLLDLSPLAPFTQQGLTNALLLIGSLSIWSLMMIETGFGQLMLIIGGATLAGTALALLAPVYGVHQRILQSKEQALGWVNAELSAEHPTFLAPRAGQESGRMADLVAYRGMIESVSDWPFTLSTYTRVAVYVLLPIVTWGIGLVAEEILERVFF